MKRLLIADDKPENLYFLRALLQGNGYQVDEARNGSEALAKARENPPDLIVSDLLMPVMDGYTLLRHWKAEERLKTIPFVVYTATYTEPKDERLALDLGADAFIIKPTEPDTFVRRIREVLAQQERGILTPSRFPTGNEEVLLKQYNEVLIRRLEAKMEQLEQTNHQLARDIAQREQAEEHIHAQAELLDLAQDAIAVSDMNSRLRYWNKGSERLSGWPASEALGRPIAEVLQPSHAIFERAKQQFLEGGQWSGELKLTTREGRTVTVMSRWTMVRDKEVRPKSVLIFNTDLTEQKRLEAQFLRAQRMESLGRLAGGIAHDLNNILAPILMAASLLRDGAASQDNRSLLDTVEKSAQRGANIVKQLLAFARGSDGQKIPVPLNRLVKEMVSMIEETFPKSITLRTELPPGLWAILGDPTQLHQVLLNLCVNARDAMPAGGTLTLAAENVMIDDCYAYMAPEARPGPHVLIQVADTGVGIPPENFERIFDPFFTTKGPDQGTGLGLATVLGIVKSHDGFIQLESEVERGTRFKVYLPAAPASAALAVETKSRPLPNGQGELILVVDDEPSIRNVTRQILERHGYRVLLAKEGTEAIALFTQHRDDVQAVLTDLMMPIMDGVATIRVLRGMSSHLRVIAASGAASKSKLGDLPDLPVQASLQKPFTAELLLSTLQRVLQG
jgi:two-component system cell cycle sensor histidine kinase/response regulator CckA